MKRNLPLLFIGSILLFTQACGSNDTAQPTEPETEMTKEAPAENSRNDDPKPSEACEFIFPSGLQTEINDAAAKLSFPVQTDSACMMTFEKKSTKAALTLIVEKHTDLALLERKVQAFEYMPNTRGKIDAGDAGTLYRQTEKHSDIITAVFRVGPYGCSITCQMKTGDPASNGILFDEDKIAELAISWGNQLKQLLQ